MSKAQKAKRDEAIKQLRERGAELLKKEDRFGDTRSGWWLDQTFLSNDPLLALQIVLGG